MLLGGAPGTAAAAVAATAAGVARARAGVCRPPAPPLAALLRRLAPPLCAPAAAFGRGRASAGRLRAAEVHTQPGARAGNAHGGDAASGDAAGARASGAAAQASRPHPQQQQPRSQALPRPRRPYLIFNPIAGQEDPAASLGAVALRLSGAFPSLTVLQTTPDARAEALARRALQEGADLVVASGGDGTIASVAGALRDTGVPLGVVPRGTANAFAVALGIPTHLDAGAADPLAFLGRACDVIAAGHAALVDMALVTTTEVTDAPCILLAGIGFEAEVIEGTSPGLKDALGPAAYILSGGAKLLQSPSNFRAKVTVDGETHEGTAAAITIVNAAPPSSLLAHGHVGDAIPDDGLLELAGYVAPEGSAAANIAGMARLAAAAFFAPPGAPPPADPDRTFGGRAAEVVVECDPPQKVVVDGEVLGTTPVAARVRPASLVVLVPRPGEGREEGGGGAAAGKATPPAFEVAGPGAATAAAAAAPGATTSAGPGASAAVGPSFEALERGLASDSEDEKGAGEEGPPKPPARGAE